MKRLMIVLLGIFALMAGRSYAGEQWGEQNPALPAKLQGVDLQSNWVNYWNSVGNVVLLSASRPGGASIVDMVYTHIAMYDAVNAIDGRYTPFAVQPSTAVSWASEEAALAAAASTVLLKFYPDQYAYINSAYAHALVDVPNNDAKSRGIAIGQEAAEKFLALRAGDGRNATIPYTFGSGPGVYQLTPGAPAPPATPQTPWIAHLKPFAMVSDSQFRAPAPSALSSDIYARDFNEIKLYGARNNSSRTAGQTAIGMFYAENPAVQLGRNLQLIAAARNLSLAESARFFAQMYVTIGDAVIAVWDSKYQYNFWRPVTAIRNADTDGNPATDADTAWLPLVTTPPHQEYPGAHGAVTGGLAYALARYFGSPDLNVTLTSTSVPGSHMTYHAFARTDSIVREIIDARVYGGMHYRSSSEAGAEIGRQVTDWVADNFFKPSGMPVPTANLQLWLRADSGLTLNGSTVSRWHDLSGNGNDALQSDVSRQPVLVAGGLNGKPVLRFDGTDRLGLTGTTPMRQISLFLVFKIDSGATGPNPYYPVCFGNTYADGTVYGLSMRNGFSGNSPDIIDPFTGVSSWLHASSAGIANFGPWKVLSVTTNKTMWNTNLRVGGTAAVNTNQGKDRPIVVPIGSSDGKGVGGIGGADNVPEGTLSFKGDIAEVVVYDTLLGEGDRQAVENYLNTKYNIVPPSIPTAGLQLWLRADTGVTMHGSTVGTWQDMSGKGHNAIQADTNRQPLLTTSAPHGRPALQFDGTNDRLGLTGTNVMTQISMFLVFKIDSGAAAVPADRFGAHPYYPITLGDTYVEGHTYGLSMRNDFSGNSPDIIDAATGIISWTHATLPGIASFGDWKVLSVTTDKLMYNTILRVGGKEAVNSPQTNTNAAISVPLGSADGLGVGGIGGADHLDPSFGSAIFKGDIAEVIVYDTVLSDQDRRGVEDYLNKKYSITAGIAAMSGREESPAAFALSQNYPNPFNPSTVIRFAVPAGVSGNVTLRVFDILGREVRTLVNDNLRPGSYETTFDAKGLASGVYFYRLSAGSFVQTNRMLLLK